RQRRCLLKGCNQRFRPRGVRDRYCSDQCLQAARKWSRWKAQHRYRKTPAGKGKRNRQCQRYRQRAKSRKPPQPEAVDETSRVITTSHFFRRLLRPARVLPRIPAAATKSIAAFLFARLPACCGVRPEKGAALEGSTRLNSDILIDHHCSRTFSLYDATGVSSPAPALGTLARARTARPPAAVGFPGGQRAADADCCGGFTGQPRPLPGD